jgi:membrane protein DedA with SNARE-associated domain
MVIAPYFFSVFLMSFVLEDASLIMGLAFIAEGKLDWITAFMACFLGISIGDIGLYLIGYLSTRVEFVRRWSLLNKVKLRLEKPQAQKTLVYAIFVSRFIPGSRLPTYLTAGLVQFPWFRFVLITLVSVFLWVMVAFLGGRSIQMVFAHHWVMALILALVLLHALKALIPPLLDKWERRALWHSWRKWTSYEFWPALFFYLPVVPLYAILSVYHRSFFMPFYANPHIFNGGIIGESKWDFLQHFPRQEPFALLTFKIPADWDLSATLEKLQQENMSYPFILKPDVGQRGFAVRIIKNEEDLREYLNNSPFDRIVQRWSSLPQEAGIFYVRMPNEKTGKIFSITDKIFPFVVGDGKTQLGELILKDKRARILAGVYFTRHAPALDSIPSVGEKVFLSECGNHCQGAIFLDGNELSSPQLVEEIDRIAKIMPDFYFGRFDIRYQSKELLMQGKEFEIVEVNGAGSEATHIWDPRTGVVEAYRVLLAQWILLFEVGHQAKVLHPNVAQVHLKDFLKESYRVYFRKDKLSVSS